MTNPDLPSLSFHGNTLRFNRKSLSDQDITPTELRDVVAANQRAIVEHIDSSYDALLLSNPEKGDVRHPSLMVISLGASAIALSEYGRLNRWQVHHHSIELDPALRPYGDAIKETGFSPLVYSRLGKKNNPQETWLALRNPDRDPNPISPLEFLPLALGFKETTHPDENDVQGELKPKMIEAYAENNQKRYLELLAQYQKLGEEVIDAEISAAFTDVRAQAQIGLIVATTLIRLEVEGNDFKYHPDKYLSYLRDASEIAYHNEFEEVEYILEREIARIERESAL